MLARRYRVTLADRLARPLLLLAPWPWLGHWPWLGPWPLLWRVLRRLPWMLRWPNLSRFLTRWLAWWLRDGGRAHLCRAGEGNPGLHPRCLRIIDGGCGVGWAEVAVGRRSFCVGRAGGGRLLAQRRNSSGWRVLFVVATGRARFIRSSRQVRGDEWRQLARGVFRDRGRCGLILFFGFSRHQIEQGDRSRLLGWFRGRARRRQGSR